MFSRFISSSICRKFTGVPVLPLRHTVYVNTQRGLFTQTATSPFQIGTVFVIHRPDDLEGVEGGRSFSTVSMHINRDDEMMVKSDSDGWNRVEKIAVTDTWNVNMTAPVSGVL